MSRERDEPPAATSQSTPRWPLGWQESRSNARLGWVTRRPVAISMVFLAVLVFGAFSLRLLPVNLMPEISYPKLTVRTHYPGAAPLEVEENVTRPLEEFLGVVTGLTRIESVSAAEQSDVILEFTWNTNMDAATQDVLETLDSARSRLPEDADPPLILRYDPALDPVLILSLGGEGLGFEAEAGHKRLRRIAERDVRRLLEPVEGVAAVKIRGGLEEEIEVELDEGQLARTRIGIDTVTARLAAENINLAGGTVSDGQTRYLVRVVNEFRDIEDIANTIISYRDGREVRLRDLAVVRAGYRDPEIATRVDGHHAVEIEVYKEAEANIVAVVRDVRKRVDTAVRPQLEHRSDGAVRLDVTADRSVFIAASIEQVRDTALVGGLLAIAVLYLFLRDFRSTLVVAIAIPVSIVATFGPLNLGGVSLNIMSLGGLALGVGMLVDNSIVVLESIYRCRQEGDDLVAAAVRGTAEVGGAVVAATLTSIAVFLPMVFVEGVGGQMFGDLGLAVVFSLLASLAVALFLIPMLSSRRAELGGNAPARSRLEGHDPLASPATQWLTSWTALAEAKQWWRAAQRRRWRLSLVPYVIARFVLQVTFEAVGKASALIVLVCLFPVVWAARAGMRGISWALSPVSSAFSFGLRACERVYPRLIRGCVRHSPFVYAGMLASLVFIGWGVSRLDTELLPTFHQGEFTAALKLPIGTPLRSTDAIVRPIEQRVLADTRGLVQRVVTTIGADRDELEQGAGGEHIARLRFDLRLDEGQGGWGARERHVIEAVRTIVGSVPDVELGIERPTLFSFKPPVEIEVRGHELDDLAAVTLEVGARMRSIAALRDVQGSIEPGSPEIRIVYDRDALARYGLDVRSVAQQLADKIGGAEPTRFRWGDRKVPIDVRLADAQRTTLSELRRIVVNPGQAQPIPLAAVAELQLERGPGEIRRVGQQRVGLVTANLSGVGLGRVEGAIEEALGDLELPAGVSVHSAGQSEEWDVSSRSLYFALGLSVFLVYVIMAAQFESLIEPLLILFTIPLAFVGVIGGLLVLDIPLSIVVVLGAIMLTGIVVNNAIVLVDYVDRLRRRGESTERALEIAGQVRLRPILMTTLTTILGLLPMAIGSGDGSELRTPMAIAVIAGLSCSTVLTLIVIPTLYAGVDRLRRGRRVDVDRRLRDELAAVPAEHLRPGVSDEIESHEEPRS